VTSASAAWSARVTMSIALDFVPATSTPSSRQPEDQLAGLARGRHRQPEQVARPARSRGAAHRAPHRPASRRAGLGQQPAGQRSQQGGSPPTAPGRPRRPARRRRVRAAAHGPWPRSGHRFRTWGPVRRAARAARPWPGPRCRGRRRPPCGRTRSRPGPARPTRPTAGQPLEVVVDVGLEPGHLRRTRPRAEDQVVGQVVPGDGRHPVGRRTPRRCGAGRGRPRPRVRCPRSSTSGSSA
jgi:hypothetical protein